MLLDASSIRMLCHTKNRYNTVKYYCIIQYVTEIILSGEVTLSRLEVTSVATLLNSQKSFQ